MSAPPSKPSSCILEIVLSLIASFTPHCCLLCSSPWTCSLPTRSCVCCLFCRRNTTPPSFSFPFLFFSHMASILGVVLPYSSTWSLLVLSEDQYFLAFSIWRTVPFLFLINWIIRRSLLPFLWKRNCSSSVWTGQGRTGYHFTIRGRYDSSQQRTSEMHVPEYVEQNVRKSNKRKNPTFKEPLQKNRRSKSKKANSHPHQSKEEGQQ